MATLTNFGVTTGGPRVGILMPKPKHKFRVRVSQFGPPSAGGGIDLTRNVVSVSRPSVASSPVAVHSYNSVAYYGAKPEFSEIELVLRDDITNAVARLVGYQEQKQMNHFQQTSAAAGSQYKFVTLIDTLDGSASGSDDDSVLETWTLEGCFLSNITWDQFDYSSSDPMQISLTIRYDNATQDGGLMPQQVSLNGSVGV